MDKRILKIIKDAIPYVKAHMPKEGFHTWAHIKYVLNYLKGFIKSPELYLAILFHDFDYKPGCDKNEKYAVIKFLKYMGTVENSDLIDLEKVSHMMLATAEPYKAYDCVETTKLIEADFAIFRDEDWNKIDEYEMLIRQEYASLCTDAEYLAGRMRFLDNLNCVTQCSDLAQFNSDRIQEVTHRLYYELRGEAVQKCI